MVTFKNWARLTKIPDDQFIYTLLCYLSPELAERVTALDLTEDQLRDPSVGLPIVQKIIEGPTNYVTRRITLSKMKQGTKSITTFAEDIRKEGLKCKFANDAVKNSNLIQAFLTGLNNKECAREVLKSNPPVENFEDAVNVAVTLALATEAVDSFNSNKLTEAREPIFPENDYPLYAIGQTPTGEDNHVEALQQKDAEIARLRTICDNSKSSRPGQGCWLCGGYNHYANTCPTRNANNDNLKCWNCGGNHFRRDCRVSQGPRPPARGDSGILAA